MLLLLLLLQQVFFGIPDVSVDVAAADDAPDRYFHMKLSGKLRLGTEEKYQRYPGDFLSNIILKKKEKITLASYIYHSSIYVLKLVIDCQEQK